MGSAFSPSLVPSQLVPSPESLLTDAAVVTPYRENEHFSGREEILKKLQSEFDPDKFQEGRFHRRVALHGRPGVG